MAGDSSQNPADGEGQPPTIRTPPREAAVAAGGGGGGKKPPTPPESPTVKDKKKRKSRRRRSSTSSSDSVDDVDPMPNLDTATWNIVKNIPFFTGQAGSTSFKAWIRMFMRWAEGQKWSDSTKLCIFLMKMRGEAAEAANELTPAERKSWSLTKSAMLARYKVVISIDAMRNAFKNRKMDESKGRSIRTR